MTRFYLGTHRPRWLEQANVPLCISYSTLSQYRRRGDDFPKGYTTWILDSKGYSELDKHGDWTISQDDYGGAVYRFMEDVGTPPDFCSPQDWMCEPHILAKTGMTVADHQEFTIDSVLYLREEFRHAPWIPVLQGWTLQDYLSHVEQYAAAGIDLTKEWMVGLGSVCRRQSTAEIGAIVTALYGLGLKLHGFGVKRDGLKKYGHMLASADSMAWSKTARDDSIHLDGCEHPGPCNNCQRYALLWRSETIAALNAPKQEAFALNFR